MQNATKIDKRLSYYPNKDAWYQFRCGDRVKATVMQLGTRSNKDKRPGRVNRQPTYQTKIDFFSWKKDNLYQI